MRFEFRHSYIKLVRIKHQLGDSDKRAGKDRWLKWGSYWSQSSSFSLEKWDLNSSISCAMRSLRQDRHSMFLPSRFFVLAILESTSATAPHRQRTLRFGDSPNMTSPNNSDVWFFEEDLVIRIWASLRSAEPTDCAQSFVAGSKACAICLCKSIALPHYEEFPPANLSALPRFSLWQNSLRVSNSPSKKQ